MVSRPKWHRLYHRASTRQEEINTLRSYDNVKEVERENRAKKNAIVQSDGRHKGRRANWKREDERNKLD